MEHEPHADLESADKDDKDIDKKKRRRVVLPSSVTLGSDKVEPTLRPEESSYAKFFEREKQEITKDVELGSPAENNLSEQSEAENDTEVDPALENLDDTEKQQVAEQYVAAMLPEVAAEMRDAIADSVEGLEAAADTALLSELQARLPDATTPEVALDDAYNAVVQTLGSPNLGKNERTLPEHEAESPQSEVDNAQVMPGATMPNTAEATTPDVQDEEVVSLPGGPPLPPSSARSTAAPMPSPGNNQPNQNFNARPSSSVTNAESLRRERVAAGRGLLIGGIVGYLIGRRRGRIKTEKKLVPVQKKLEKQVQDLHEKIAIKERQVRKLAAQKAEIVSVAATRSETIQQLRHNHINKSGEAIVERILEQSADTMTLTEVEHANVPALLAVAETISIGSQSLRHMYETNQLNERSLRIVVREHLRGGNAQEVVARELVAKELPFERDPSARSQAAGMTAMPQDSSQAAKTNSADRTSLPMPATHYSASDHALLSTNGKPARHSSQAILGIAVILAFAAALALVALLR